TLQLYDKALASPRASLPVTAPHREIAAALVGQRRWAAAIDEFTLLRERLQDERLYRRLTEDDPTLAIALLRSARDAEAAALLAPALDRSRRVRGDKNPSTAEFLGLQAIAMMARGDQISARKQFAEAAAVLLDTTSHVDDESVPRGEQGRRRSWIL